MDLRGAREGTAAARHVISGVFMQVVDFIGAFCMPGNRAKNPSVRHIKQLAQLWAGSAQSYPQNEWKVEKAQRNQGLGGALSSQLEHCALTARSGDR
jgi:hypothetical protein